MTDRQITIVRAKHGELPYFMMNRATAQDNTLSWEARGVLAYLLSKPDDWQINLVDLQQNCGRDKARSIVAELLIHGYMTKSDQAQGQRGRFDNVTYQLHESPFTEKPSTVAPSTVKPTQHNTEEQSTEKHKDSNTSPQPAVTVGEAVNSPKVDPVPQPPNLPSYTAPPRTRWIYPLDGIHCHLVRDANQPTVTLCGISPLPSYGGIAANTQVQCSECLKATEKRPKPEPLQESSEPKKKSSGKRKRAEVPPAGDPALDAITVLCYGTKDAYAPNSKRIRKCYADAASTGSPPTLEELRSFYSWWKQNDWRGKKGQPPNTYQVSELWATFKLSMSNPGAVSHEPITQQHPGGSNSPSGESRTSTVDPAKERELADKLFREIDERVAMRALQGNGLLPDRKTG